MARKENNMIAELESTQEAVANRNYKAEKYRDGQATLKTLSKKCHRNQEMKTKHGKVMRTGRQQTHNRSLAEKVRVRDNLDYNE